MRRSQVEPQIRTSGVTDEGNIDAPAGSMETCTL